MNEIYIEKWLTFTLIDGRWDIQLWAGSAKPVSAKVYRLHIKVPATGRSGGNGKQLTEGKTASRGIPERGDGRSGTQHI